MAPYRVFLVDTLNVLGSDDRRTEVKAMLQTYFDPIAKGAGIKEGAVVSFVSANPQASDTELICYYTPYGWHVVTQIEDGKIAAPAEGGLTVSNSKVSGSDVHVGEDFDTRTIANLTFHELMHNKLGLGDAMHHQGGLAAGRVNDSLRPTANNIKRMSKALNTPRPQWTGGFEALKDRHKKVSM